MSVSEDWDRWFSEFAEKWPEKLEPLFEREPAKKQEWAIWLCTRLPAFVPTAAVECFTTAAPADIEWLASALRDHWKRWFVASLVSRTGWVPEALFEPMLQAAADAQEPSLGAKWFVEPCEVVFGSEPVVSYLVSIAESADDPQLAVGALDALYPRTRLTDAIIEQRRTFLLQGVTDEKTSTYARYRLRLHLRLDDAAFAHAMAVFDLLRQDRCDEVATQFNSQLIAELTSTQLRDVWTSIRQQTGAFQSYVERRVTAAEAGLTTVVLGCQFEKTISDFLVAFDNDHKIAALRVTKRLI